MNLLKRNIGLNFDAQNNAVICVWAPNADSVAVKVIHTGLILELNSGERGYWNLVSAEIKIGDRYVFVIDGKELPDPASLAQREGVHEASEAISLNFSWTDESWKNIPLEHYILYELHTGTFSASGDFKGIEARLDHLVELGVTAIELMPIASFPGSRNWGYDGVFLFAVQQSYGGPEGLQHLVNVCHEKGLAVILDVVYNHLGPEGNYLSEFGPYFTDKYHTPWGNAINYDDQNCDGVRDFMVENVLMWFRDFHIDALRLDAVHAIKDFSAVHLLQLIREKTDELMEHTGRKHYLIAESDLNDPKYISPVADHGLGMDAQWVDEFHHALRVTAGEPAKGYYADFSGIDHLAKSYCDAYVYTGTYSAERKKTFGKTAAGHPGQQFIVFSQNHDQVGNRMLGERSSTLFSFEMQKLMAAAVLSAPFLPMLFMGEEWGETNPFLYFVSHTDLELVELVRKGRKAEFTEMHGAGEAPDPQDESTFLASKLNWSRLSEPDHRILFQFYKKLIALRKNTVLGNGDREGTHVHLLAKQHALLLERGTSGDLDLVLCGMNFSKQPQSLVIPPHLKIHLKLIDSAAPEWLGTGTAAVIADPDRSISCSDNADVIPEMQDKTEKLLLQPESFIAYSASYV
ncbi:malto-oligosyltrehalose trehalohydrolase [Pedobacter metabolipauper]|uniref:Malto-oligosyltrehalose trehalohydrolase n=1 Tax=Pedobacter metabolipauper TaxID=425513 RepID=A0A4R6SZP7_9SPHI|nr:malto-oligosyltrehalose trehalohydrolase [Pedobacter metabolipauper]TDQ10025.1 maltooligosyl trehalose hydrolase [Pedobacter metabolipauper]